jgi:hypothetical protein
MGMSIAAAAFLIAGVVMMLFGGKIFYETVIFLRVAARAVGTVIRIAPSRNSDGQAMYLPIFEYRTNDGSAYQYISTVASNPPAYNVGETATILYHQRNPRHARIHSFTELWLLQAVLFFFGSICVFASIYILLNFGL